MALCEGKRTRGGKEPTLLLARRSLQLLYRIMIKRKKKGEKKKKKKKKKKKGGKKKVKENGFGAEGAPRPGIAGGHEKNRSRSRTTQQQPQLRGAGPGGAGEARGEPGVASRVCGPSATLSPARARPPRPTRCLSPSSFPPEPREPYSRGRAPASATSRPRPSPAAQSGPPGISAARPPSPSRPAPHRARTAQHGPYGPARPGSATGRGAAGHSIPAWLFQRAPRENRKFASCGPESSPGAPRNANGMERRSGGSGAPRGAAERCGERRGLTSQRHIPSAAPLLSAGRGAPPGTDALPKSCPQNSLSPLRLRRRCDAEVLGRRQRLTPRWLSARSGRGVRRSGAGAHLSDWRPRANGCGRSCLASTALHWPISTA